MKWWEILLMALFTVPLLLLFLVEVVLNPILENRKYKQKFINWNNAHPHLNRIKCKNCKYAIKETLWEGRYPKGIPTRKPTYCKLIKRKIHNNRCVIAEPPNEYFFEPKEQKELLPCSNTKIYYSAYGNCYHSTPHCKTIKKSQHIYASCSVPSDRYPCPKCWKDVDGTLYAK